MKRKLKAKEYELVEAVLKDSVDKGVIEDTQRKDVLAYYEKSSGFDFIKVLSTIGGILVGLGVLLIILGNWTAIHPVMQLIILMTAVSATVGVSLIIKKSRPLLADALLYLALLIYGASLFLINIGFNFNIEVNRLFFVWTISAIILSALYKDVLLLIGAHILALGFILSSGDQFIVVPLVLLLTVFFGGNYYFNYHKIITFATLVLLLVAVVHTLGYFDVTSTIIHLVMVGLGLAFTHVKHDLNLKVFKLVGLLSVGFSGLFLTIPYEWTDLGFVESGQIFSIPFSIILALYALYMTSQKYIVALVIVSAIIVRYYFDTFFDFMPRALFFMIGGLIILGLVYVIEKARKEGGVKHG